jgi:hypothetical protein
MNSSIRLAGDTAEVLRQQFVLHVQPYIYTRTTIYIWLHIYMVYMYGCIYTHTYMNRSIGLAGDTAEVLRQQFLRSFRRRCSRCFCQPILFFFLHIFFTQTHFFCLHIRILLLCPNAHAAFANVSCFVFDTLFFKYTWAFFLYTHTHFTLVRKCSRYFCQIFQCVCMLYVSVIKLK